MRVPGGARGVDYARRHVRAGWRSLLFFATMGIVLESLHGFKVHAYLDVSSDARRLMWTLAHAYGTLLALLQIVFGLTVPVVSKYLDVGAEIACPERQRTAPPKGRPRSAPTTMASDLRLVSWSLMGAGVLIPGGFLLGGLGADGDPGLGVVLVPIGGSLLVWGLFWIARATASRGAAL